MFEVTRNKLYIFLFFVSFYTLGYLYKKRGTQIITLVNNVEVQKRLVDEIIGAAVSSGEKNFSHFGKKIDLSELTVTFNPFGSPLLGGPYVLLVFSELSCNVCQDEESQFANELIGLLGEGRVRSVIHSRNRRYAAQYIRLNQVKFPVYHISDDGFLLKNDIQDTPLVLFVDENGFVVFAHSPIPGYPEFSKPFHDFCLSYFGQR